jgi:FkbM family methyltransferase
VPVPPFTGCTVTTPVFLAHCRVLVDSFFQHDPDAAFTLLYIGHTGATPGDRAAKLGLDPRTVVLEPAELVDESELARLGLMYSTQGFAGALKGRLLDHVVREGGRPGILIDADICIYRSLAPIAERAEVAGTVLTTHIRRPLIEAERPTILAGVFNSGFVAAAEKGLPLLEWWNERTARHCVLSAAEGLVWEQTWLGLAPAFFPLEVLPDPGVNAMTRDLIDNDIVWGPDGPSLRESPLVCFHYSGPYDPHAPDYLLAAAPVGEGVVMRPEGAPPSAQLAWLSLEGRPGAARMSREYAERLIAARFDEAITTPIIYSRLPDGTQLHPAMRHAYRLGLLEAEENGTEEPPNPFRGDTTEELMSWLEEKPTRNAAEQGLTRFLLAIHDSYSGAASIFPSVPGQDTDQFLAWAWERLRSEAATPVPARLLPSRDAARFGRRDAERLRRELATIKAGRTWRLTRLPRRISGRLRGRPRPEPEEAKPEGVSLRLLQAFAEQNPQARFVEIGANDGQRLDPLSAYVAKGGWTGIMVEPVPYVFERLRRHFDGNERIAVENAAIADSGGTRPFYHLAEDAGDEGGAPVWWYDAIGSFERDHLYKHESVIPNLESRVRQIDVECMTVGELLRKHEMDAVDLILIDTEGYDAEIVASIDFDRIRPRLLIYEHHHLADDVRAECERRLRGLGYELVADGLDTWCLDTRPDDNLTKIWREAGAGSSSSGPTATR